MKTEINFGVSFNCRVGLSEIGRETIINSVGGMSLDDFDLEDPDQAKGYKYLVELKEYVDNPDKLVEVFMSKFMKEELTTLLAKSKDGLEDDDEFSINYTDLSIEKTEAKHG